MQKLHKKLSLSIIASIVCIQLLSYSVENFSGFTLWYQSRFYPAISSACRVAFGWVPFSIGDIFYLILMFFIIFKVFHFLQLLFKKQFQRSFIHVLHMINMGCILYALFLILWAGNYHRPSFALQIHLKKDSINVKQLREITLLMIEKSNQNLKNWKENSLQSSVKEAFLLYQKENLTAFKHQSFKTSLMAPLISKLGVMGYYQPFFAEGTLNSNIPKVDYPFIICHEMAHQKGIAYEDEAHLMAVWLIKNHGSETFKFSMYINMLDYLLPQIKKRLPKEYPFFIKKIQPFVQNILIERKKYWLQQTGLLNNITTIIFDRILKINKQEKGIVSYDDIVLYLYKLYLDHQ